MSPPGDLRGTGRATGLLLPVVALAILSLTVSLATRTFGVNIPNSISVHEASAQGTRQHMDRDSVGWVPPVPVLTALQAPTFYPHVAPAGPPLPSLFLEESLYNRPPPSC